MKAVPTTVSTTVAGGMTAALHGFTPKDWWISAIAGRELVGGNFAVYADIPAAQMGPLALALGGLLPRAVYLTCLVGLFAVVMHATRGLTNGLAHCVAGLLVAPMWAYTAAAGHADELIVMAAMVLLVRAVREGNELAAVLLLVVGLAAKPTAVLFLPLVLLVSRRAVAVILAGAAAIYMPFVLADSAGFFAAGGGFNPVQNGSLIDWIGYPVGDAYPAWVRPAQLVGGWLIVWLIGQRRGLVVALIVALAWRATLEPAPWGSYSMPVAVAALMLPVVWRSAVASGLVLLSWTAVIEYPMTDTQGAARLVLLWAAVLACLPLLRGVRAGQHAFTAYGLPDAANPERRTA